MTHPVLSRLFSEEFFLEVGFLLPPAALRRHLQRLRWVRSIHVAVRLGAIRGEHVRAFATEATRDFRPGELLANEAGLAALAVALESCPYEFAEEYLHELARLRLAEVGTAVRVARECLRARYSRPKTEARRFAYAIRTRRVSSGLVATQRGTGVAKYGISQVVRFETAGSC